MNIIKGRGTRNGEPRIILILSLPARHTLGLPAPILTHIHSPILTPIHARKVLHTEVPSHQIIPAITVQTRETRGACAHVCG